MLECKISDKGIEKLTLSGDIADITSQVMTLINRVYEVMLESNKDIADKFKEMITDAVNYNVLFATKEDEMIDCLKNLVSKVTIK